MVYTIKNKCAELPEMEYEDGASTLFLYTKGTEGIPSATVEQLLRYMENSTYENAVNEELRKIHRMVETVKRDPEVGGMHIQMVDEIYELRQMNAKLTEEKEEITRQAEENVRQAEENIKQAEEKNTRLAEENAKLRDELNRRSAMEKAADNS